MANQERHTLLTTYAQSNTATYGVYSGQTFSNDVYTQTFVDYVPRVTPGFVLLKKNGQRIPPLPYVHKKRFYTVHWGHESRFQVGNEKSVRVSHTVGPIGSYLGFNEDFATLKANATNTATLKLLEKLKDSKFNAAQAYAESSQLQRMIGTTAINLAGVFQHLRRGQLSAAGSRLGLVIGKRQHARYNREFKRIKTNADIDKMLSNGVLAVQYGIRPLISDVIGAAELYAQKRAEEVINIVKVSSIAHVQKNESKKMSDPYGYGTIAGTMTTTGTVRIEYGCTFAKGSEVVHTLKQLGLTNPLHLAWELLPWSFVIDWFIPIGNYLSSIDATLGLDFKTGYKSVSASLHSEQTQERTTTGGSGTYRMSGSARRIAFEKSFERTILSSFPSARLPQFKNPVSWEHALNGIALLAGFKKTAYRTPRD